MNSFRSEKRGEQECKNMLRGMMWTFSLGINILRECKICSYFCFSSSNFESLNNVSVNSISKRTYFTDRNRMYGMTHYLCSISVLGTFCWYIFLL